MMKLKLNIKQKDFLYTVLQISGIVVLSILFQRVLEVFIISILFFIFRRKYTKTFHAKTLRDCTLYTLIMFLIICLILPPLQSSYGVIIILCYVTTEALYFISDYLDLTKVKKFKIYKGMNKDILIEKCKLYDLNDLEIKILVSYYCDGLKRWQIGNQLNYSEDRISQLKKQALDKLA